MQQLADLMEQFERASQGYATGNDINRDDDWFVLKMHEELGELTQIWMKLTARGRTHGLSPETLREELANEAADLLGHVLLFINQHNIDIAGAVNRKWRFDPSVPKPRD